MVLLEITSNTESFRTKFALKLLLFLEEQEIELKRLKCRAIESFNNSGSFVATDLYQMDDKMPFKPGITSKAIATLITLDLPLLEVNGNSKMDKLANVKIFNLKIS